MGAPATTWDTAFEAVPAGTDLLSTVDTIIQTHKSATRERMEREHNWALAGTQSKHGWHKAGSAISFYQAAAPTNKLDPSATALDADDAGRLWVDTDTFYPYVWTGSAWTALVVASTALATLATDATTADRVKDQTGGASLRCKVINIGDLVLGGAAHRTATVAHGLTLSTIRSVQVTVRNDADSFYVAFPTIVDISNTAAVVGCGFSVDGTNVTIKDRTNGTSTGFQNYITSALLLSFTATDWDATGYNRGWITIWYTV